MGLGWIKKGILENAHGIIPVKYPEFKHLACSKEKGRRARRDIVHLLKEIKKGK